MKIIIVGCGKVGVSLAERLSAEGHDLVMVDMNPQKVEHLSNQFDALGIVGNGASFNIQQEAGVENADLFIAVTGEDELNLLCCLMAKKTGHCDTIARVRNPLYNKEIRFIQEKLGLSMIIGGGTIAHYLAQDLLKIGFRVRIIEQRKERCDYLSEVIPGADIINGDGSDRDLLLEEGLTYADSLVALTGLDEENIFLALYGKLHSNAKLIAKVNKIAFDDVIDSFGIDSIIYPKYLTADYILQYVRARQNTIGCNVETLYKILDGRAEALEFSIKEDSAVTNVPLMDLNLKDNLLICCINRNGQILTPRGQNIIKVGDTVILVTTNRGLGDIRDILKS